MREGKNCVTLRRADLEPHDAFYDLSKLYEQAFGTPFVELDWFDLLQRLYVSLAL